MEITLGQHYNVREKPTVKLYTYINRHAGTPIRKTVKTRDGIARGDHTHWACLLLPRVIFHYFSSTSR